MSVDGLLPAFYQPPSLECKTSDSAVGGDRVLPATCRLLTDRNAEVIMAARAFSGEVLGHCGATHIAATTGDLTWAVRL
jgi:hypothetical protein